VSTAHQDDAAARAEQVLAGRGARITQLRRDVLRALMREDRPVGAYQLFDQLKARDAASAPPAVYRALDFLVGEGVAHKLQSLNAYVGCACFEHAHDAHFLICRGCNAAEEVPTTAIRKQVDTDAAERGFAVERMVVETVGLCADCKGRA
jgi:Fur family zinc uptake transcriptional regulator